MSKKTVPTNAASSGVTLDRKTLKTIARRSDRPGLDRIEDHLYPGATDNHVRAVMHMVVDRVTKEEVKDEEDAEEVRMTLEDAVITTDLKVCKHFTM